MLNLLFLEENIVRNSIDLILSSKDSLEPNNRYLK